MQPPPQSTTSVKEKNVMKNLSKNIFSTAGLLVVMFTSNISTAQETTPSVMDIKITSSTQSFKKIRKNKSFALNTLKRTDTMQTQPISKMKSQYLIHDSLPSGKFNGR